MIKYIQIALILSCFISCKTISIQNEAQQTTSENIMLGTIGQQKDFVLEQDYNHTALPDYNQPIKVKPNLVVFNNQSFKAFKKAQQTQNKRVIVNYVDSVKTKQPSFFKLEIADRVGVLNTLKNEVNSDVFQFLKNNNQTHIVTSISVALSQDNINAIKNADEVFLQTSGIKNYVLKTYIDKELQQTIKFTDAVVFTFQTSNACWKQNDKYQLEIIDLVEGTDKCPDQSYKSAKRAKKKINYFKL